MMAVIRSPTSTGALTPTGNAAFVTELQAVQRHQCARCSVTVSGYRLGKIKDLTGVVIAAGCLGQRLGGLYNLQAGDRRCGRDCRPRKGFSPGCPFCPPAGFFDRSQQAAGAGRLLTQPVAGRRLAAVRAVQPQAALQLHHPRHQRGILMAHRVVLCRKRRPSLASAAFCAISRSMLPARLQRTSYRRLHRRGCSGTRRRDLGHVTGAFRVEPRRGLSSVYLLSRPDQ